MIVFKTVFKFYSSRGIKKIKEEEIIRSIDRIVLVFWTTPGRNSISTIPDTIY